MRRLSWVLYALLVLGSASAMADERRVALVVGASAYQHAPQLPNTRADATAISAALQRLGFEVDRLLDPDRAALEAAVRRFGRNSAGADAALFFYAGHALESAGENWMVPVSADIASDRDLRFEALDLDTILDQMNGGARVSLVFLDSCRDNPFRLRITSGTRDFSGGGLGRVNAAVGTFIAFATAPGNFAEDGSGPDSPFTTALLASIEKPGLEVRQMMSEVRKAVREATGGRQIPWDTSALEGQFYFKPPAQPTQNVNQPFPSNDQIETIFWDSVRNSRDPANIQAYLNRYPKGLFADVARNLLKQIQPQIRQSDAVPTPPPIVGPPTELMVTRLASAAPGINDQLKDSIARAYQTLPSHKALALPPGSVGPLWRAGGLESAAFAQEQSLESCQIYFGQPCILVVVDDVLQPDPQAGNWPRYDMPRVRYVGAFDPQRIPVATTTVRQQSDVAAYASAVEPKAMALHPWGLLYVEAGAASSQDAQAKALDKCKADPAHRGSAAGCYLYAISNQVVLPYRLKDPQAGPLPPNPPSPPSPLSLHDAVVTRLASIAPNLALPTRDNDIAAYQAGKKPKALAFSRQPPAFWPAFDQEDSATSQTVALERCQLGSGAPCMLAAIGDIVPGSDGRWAPREMARVRYAAAFDPGRVPVVPSSVRQRPDVTQYAAAPWPKAAAFHPSGKLVTATNAPSAQAAQDTALASCNSDPAVKSANSPCFVYAVGNRVVLPLRWVKSWSPADALVHALSKPSDKYSAVDDVLTYAVVYTGHKALARFPERDATFMIGGFSNSADAESVALESCQQIYADPCVLVASDDNVLAPDLARAQRRAAARLSYKGPFRPDMFPFLRDPQRKELLDYAALPEPKALAVRSRNGDPLIASATGTSPADAQARALAQCNGPSMGPYPCFLYAVNGQVVLPQRRTEPMR